MKILNKILKFIRPNKEDEEIDQIATKIGDVGINPPGKPKQKKEEKK